MKVTLKDIVLVSVALFALYQWWNKSNYASEKDDIQRKYEVQRELRIKVQQTFADYRDSTAVVNDSLETEIRLRDKDYQALEGNYDTAIKYLDKIKTDEELQDIFNNSYPHSN